MPPRTHPPPPQHPKLDDWLASSLARAVLGLPELRAVFAAWDDGGGAAALSAIEMEAVAAAAWAAALRELPSPFACVGW